MVHDYLEPGIMKWPNVS